MKGWVSLPCWLTYRGHLTHKVIIRPASSRAQDRESSPVKDQLSTTVLHRQLASFWRKFLVLFQASFCRETPLLIGRSTGDRIFPKHITTFLNKKLAQCERVTCASFLAQVFWCKKTCDRNLLVWMQLNNNWLGCITLTWHATVTTVFLIIHKCSIILYFWMQLLNASITNINA